MRHGIFDSEQRHILVAPKDAVALRHHAAPYRNALRCTGKGTYDAHPWRVCRASTPTPHERIYLHLLGYPTRTPPLHAVAGEDCGKLNIVYLHTKPA